MYQVKEEEVECTLSMSAEARPIEEFQCEDRVDEVYFDPEVSVFEERNASELNESVFFSGSNNSCFSRSVAELNSFDEFIAKTKSLYKITSFRLLNEQFSTKNDVGEIIVKLSLKSLTKCRDKSETSNVVITQNRRASSVSTVQKQRIVLIKKMDPIMHGSLVLIPIHDPIQIYRDGVSEEVVSTSSDVVADNMKAEVDTCESALNDHKSTENEHCMSFEMPLEKENETLIANFLNPSTKFDSNLVGSENQSAFENELKCEVCGKCYQSKNSLIRHKLQNHVDITSVVGGNKREWKCNLCGKTFPSDGSLARHKILKRCCFKRVTTPPVKIRSSKSNLCDMCGRSFTNRTFLLRHQMKDHNMSFGNVISEENHQCSYCGKMFGSNSKLHIHVLEHQGRKYQCPHCPDVDPFPKPYFYRNHIVKFHHPRKCAVCGVSCTGKIGYAQHLKSHHPDENLQVLLYSKKYKCSNCDASFTCLTGLEEHDRVKHRGILFDCPVCGRKLKSSRCLQLHLRTHGIGVRHKCDDCNMTFSQMGHMVQHIRVNHPERLPEKYAADYTCPDCGKSFKNRNSVVKHQETKHLGFSYSCPDCEKSFGSRSGLNTHRRNYCTVGTKQNIN